jgi:ribonuclease BN (tRNA processing enzyme)
VVVGLTVTPLGTCGSYPGPGGACSGYLVRGEGTTVWVDAGNGTMANLQHHTDLPDIDAVVLSHEHPDHWADIEGFRVACAYVIGRRDVPLYAPRSLRRVLSGNVKKVFDWHDVADSDEARIGGLGFRFSRTDHGPETLAMRIDGGGRSLAYSADTGPRWSFTRLGPGIDAALCEATFTAPFEGASRHLSGRQAAHLAGDADVGRLLLTHFWPTLSTDEIVAEAAAEFGGTVEAAATNKEYEV